MKSIQRKSRKKRPCCYCSRSIEIGELCIEYVTYPSDGWASFDVPVRDYECSDCIAARATLLSKIR